MKEVSFRHEPRIRVFLAKMLRNVAGNVVTKLTALVNVLYNILQMAFLMNFMDSENRCITQLFGDFSMKKACTSSIAWLGRPNNNAPSEFHLNVKLSRADSDVTDRCQVVN